MASSTNQQDEDWQSTKKSVIQRSCHMFNNPFMSDFAFTCDGSDKKIFVHKYVLATSSSVFYKMFYGELAEKESIVQISDTNEESLAEFLRYLYTDKCNLTTDNAWSVLNLARKYILPALVQKSIEFLEGNLTAENAFSVLQHPIHFNDEDLQKKSWELIDLKTSAAVASKAFTEIDQATLAKLLERESLNVREVDLFEAVLKWTEAECLRKEIEHNPENKRDVLGRSIYEIRFASMTLQEFALHASTSCLLTNEQMVFFYEKFGGIEKTSEVWNMSERGAEIVQRCSRFLRHGRLKYEDISIEHAIGVSFNKPVKFHGVHMLEFAQENEYHVKLEVNSQVIEKEFRAKEDIHRRVSGFDVMLPEPVEVEAGVTVQLKASLIDTTHVLQHSGFDGQETVETNGVIVKFSNITGAYNGITNVEKGQFDQIIFSII